MERRKAVTAAAAASATFLFGAAGLTANATILGNHDKGGVGEISPVVSGVDQPELAAGAAPDPTSTTAAPTTTTAAPTTTAAAGAPGAAPGPGGWPTSEAPRSGGGNVAAPQPAPAPQVAPTPTTAPQSAPTSSHTGGSTVASGGEDHEDEVEHEEEHEEEHEVEVEGAEDDD